MSKSDDSAGAGCFGFIMLVLAVGFVLTYWVQILLTLLVIGAIAGAGYGLFKWATAAQLRAEQKRLCPVCQSWANSVILAEIDSAGTGLCPAHAARWRKIYELEGEILGEDGRFL